MKAAAVHTRASAATARNGRSLGLSTDPVDSATAASLRYMSDSTPGIRRRQNGKGFVYIRADAKAIRDPEELRRFKALAIPPAWREVWISPIPNGHLQATGRDAKGRKQYRYHPRWREVRDENKYDRMVAFAKVLPLIRKKVHRDLGLPGLPRDKVLATVVRLLETTLIRVGNDEYARDNGSFGLATMRNHHVDVSGSNMRFEFRGKSRVQHAIDLNDRRLAKIVKRCQHLPGHELFQYIGDDEQRYSVGSSEVNEYLRQIAGDDFSTKDFRTWAGTVLAARALQQFEAFDSKAQAKRNIVQAIESVAKKMGNTKAVCRKCYVHPAVINAYTDGSLLRVLSQRVENEMTKSLHKLSPEEAAVMALLQQQLKTPKWENNGSSRKAHRRHRESGGVRRARSGKEQGVWSRGRRLDVRGRIV